MGTTSIRLASQALGLVRERAISSFSDGTNQAEIMQLYYTDFAEDVLTRYPWSFATKKRRFNQDSEPPLNEYRYSHIVPAEALRIWTVFESNHVGAPPLNEYDIQSVNGQRRIYSNYQDLYVDYTVYTDESNWTASFINFAMYALAAHIAIPVTDDDALAARMQTIAYGSPAENEKGGKFSVAVTIDAAQKPNKPIQSDPFNQARFS